jgi:L-amino acid N-acyltransferase YncA
MSQTAGILTYYIHNSMVTFRHKPITEESALGTLRECTAASLPYLVAAEQAEISRPGGESTAREVVQAFALARPFRADRDGYLHTAELTIFARHGATGRGIGTRLLGALIEELKAGGRVRQLLAIMTVDADEACAERLKGFYARFGFEEVGRLRRVGWKFDTWIDTRYMQLELPWPEGEGGSRGAGRRRGDVFDEPTNVRPAP